MAARLVSKPELSCTCIHLIAALPLTLGFSTLGAPLLSASSSSPPSPQPPPSPGFRSTLGLNSPQGSVSLPYSPIFQGLITYAFVAFYLRAFSQGVHLTHSLPLETASSHPLLTSISLSLELTVPASILSPHCLLALSGLCPPAVGKAWTLDRAGHWEVAANIYWGRLKSHLPSPASLWVALEEEPEVGSTGLCSTIKQSGQTFCDPGFSKFLSRSLERGCM